MLKKATNLLNVSYKLFLGPFLHNLFPAASLAGCRYTPTCSVYMQEAVSKYGFWIGILKSILRIYKCHPFSRGGYDPA